MKGNAEQRKNISRSGKFSRLIGRMKDPEWRKYATLVIVGKMLGLSLVFAIMLGIPAALTTAPKLVSPTMARAGEDKPAPAPAVTTTPATTTPAATTPAVVVEAPVIAGPPVVTPPTTVAATTSAPAAAPAPVDPLKDIKPGDTVNPLNTVWTLMAAFLVFCMQVGFIMLEAGFCRSRETVNVLVECVFDTCLCGILFYAWGFAFMFGHGNGFIGWGGADGRTWYFLQNAPATYEATGVSFLAVWVFQFAFADTCSTITSGAMIGRTAFWGDILYSFGVTGFIYPIIGHWAWGPDGFLATMGSKGMFYESLGVGFHDFAGSTVVHTIGGMISLAGAVVLGPRVGRTFKIDGGGPMAPHDLTIAVCGAMLLWFGWYGFNPGSTLSAMDMDGIGRISANTTLAACSGGMGGVIYAYIMWNRKWDPGAISNGVLGGLVAITCPCYWVTPTGAVILGFVAGLIVMLTIESFEYLRIDDPIGAVPVHGFCGMWGTISLGLFASGDYGATGQTGADNSPGAVLTGLFYGGSPQVLTAQIIGSLSITTATLAVSFAMFYALHFMGVLRLSREDELHGLDITEHGISAYPEYVISAEAAPTGVPVQLVNPVVAKPEPVAPQFPFA